MVGGASGWEKPRGGWRGVVNSGERPFGRVFLGAELLLSQFGVPFLGGVGLFLHPFGVPHLGDMGLLRHRFEVPPFWRMWGSLSTNSRSPHFGGSFFGVPTSVFTWVTFNSVLQDYSFSPGTTILLLFRPKQATLQLPTLQAVGKWGHLCHRHHESPLSPPPVPPWVSQGGHLSWGGLFQHSHLILSVPQVLTCPRIWVSSVVCGC